MLKRLFTIALKVLLVFLPVSAPAATYYVDSVLGNDSNNGTTTNTPWATLGKVNGLTFSAGDQVLFERGNVWTNGSLIISSSGTSNAPIYFGAYGPANRPKPLICVGNGLINTNQTANSAAIFINASYVTVQNFAVNNFDGADIFDGGEGNRVGIYIGQWGGAQSGIQVLDNEVYYIEGFSNDPGVAVPPRGTSLNPTNYNEYGCAAIYSRANENGLLIDGNYVHDCTGNGIMVQATDVGQGLGEVIQNNTITNIGADGIEVLYAIDLLVQSNTCVGVGNNSYTNARAAGVLGYNGLAVGGMWAFGCSNFVFQYNYCQGTHQIFYDGEAWDFDGNNSGTCIYQYNFSRDNEGGFLLSVADTNPGYTRICRYNISIDDGLKQEQGKGEFFFNGTCDQCYNNIFYRDDGDGFFKSNNSYYQPLVWDFYNNVFWTTATSNTTYQTATCIFSNNCFYGHTPVNPGANAIIANPLFTNLSAATNAYSITAVSGFQLQAGSPLINAGIYIANNGGQDFWGDALPVGSPDIGAGEVVNPVQVAVQASGTNLVLSWSNGTLQSAPAVTGPWMDLTGTNSPYTLSPAGSQNFFRVKVP